MSEKPPAFTDAVSYGEAVARFAAIAELRVRDLPDDEKLRLQRSGTLPQLWFEPIDATWLRLGMLVDDGVVELGRVARAAFMRSPPSPS